MRSLRDRSLRRALQVKPSVVRAAEKVTMSAIEVFATVAKEFCSWAEGPAGSEANEAVAARSHLAHLYVAALGLKDTFVECEAEGPTQPEWQEMFQRFGALPFSYYAFADPQNVPPGEPMLADLGDDLADIWRDLKVGLSLYQKGDVAGAQHEWRSTFDIHWGRHAARALWALDEWLAGGAQ